MVYNGSRIEKIRGAWGQVVKYHYQAPKPPQNKRFQEENMNTKNVIITTKKVSNELCVEHVRMAKKLVRLLKKMGVSYYSFCFMDKDFHQTDKERLDKDFFNVNIRDVSSNSILSFSGE